MDVETKLMKVGILIRLICTLAPDVFDRENPKPLAIGVCDRLVAKMKGRFTREEVNDFLKWWCNRREYIEAVAAGGPRYLPSGVVRGEVSAKHKAFAEKQLELMKVES